MKVALQGSTPTRRLAKRATWLLNHLAGSGRRILSENLGTAFERSKYSVLATLADDGAAIQNEISSRTGLDGGDLVGILDRLQADGQIKRSSDPADRRRNLVEITAEGRVELRRLEVLVEEAQVLLLEPLDETERMEFLRLMKILLQAHERFEFPNEPGLENNR